MVDALRIAGAALGLLAGAFAKNAHQAPKARVANDAAAFAPLAEGAVWQYRTETQAVEGLAPTESRNVVAVVGRYRDAGVERALVRSAGWGRPYQHWQLDGSGVLILESQNSHCISSFDPDELPQRPLACPVGAVTQWSWREPAVRAARGNGNRERTWTARIQAYETSVTVPAGTFCAVHVRCESRENEMPMEREAWYVRGIGCVRELRRTGSGYRLRELLSFEPGRDSSALRRSMLEIQLPPDWMWSPRGPARVDWLELGVESLALPGRFALIDDGIERRCAFVGPRGVTPLDASRGQAWCDLLAGLDLHCNRPTPETLARLVARLVAHQSGDTIMRLNTDEERTTRARSLFDPVSVPLQLTDAGRAREAVLTVDLGRSKVELDVTR